jgi:hypothetical protein
LICELQALDSNSSSFAVVTELTLKRRNARDTSVDFKDGRTNNLKPLTLVKKTIPLKYGGIFHGDGRKPANNWIDIK